MECYVVKYRLSKWKRKLCSAFELFASKQYSFIPVGSLIKEGGIKAVIEYYKLSGGEYYDSGPLTGKKMVKFYTYEERL